MKYLLSFAAVAGLLAGVAWWGVPREPLLQAIGLQSAVTAPAGPTGAGSGSARSDIGPAVVEVAQARKAQRTRDIKAIGSLQSDESVQLAPEIAGRIAEIVFTEGRPVKKGDVLVKLDAALAEAELAQSRARLTLAEANNDRARALSRTGNVTERSRDEAVATFETARAEVELNKTRVDKHTLRAPFDGVAGVRSVSVGAYVSAGTPIVNIEKIDRLKVDFQVPELNLRDVKTGQSLDVKVDALPQRAFTGEIYAINPQIDVNGRALQVRARLANADGALRPGLFARIAIKGQSEDEVVLIPESAVLPRGGDTFVFRIDNGKAVEERVVLGARSGGEVEIVEGLSSGVTIVTAGQQNLRNGAAVEIVTSRASPPLPPAAIPTGSTRRS